MKRALGTILVATLTWTLTAAVRPALAQGTETAEPNPHPAPASPSSEHPPASPSAPATLAVDTAQLAPAPVRSAPPPEPPAPTPPAVAQPAPARTLEPAQARSFAVGELGFVDPIAHSIQFGKQGTKFDYVKDGGQDVLFPTLRLSAEATFGAAHTFIFLYQPLNLETRETLRDDLVVDDVTFAAGTPIDFRYGFDYYRVSYLYDFAHGSTTDELSLGASLQLRDAIIDFTSADGLQRRSNRNVGPVPLVKFRGRTEVAHPFWLALEADGMYAPVKYINGGRSDVEGAILDVSAQFGYRVAPALDVFFGVRYVGGGAKGTSESDAERGPGDGYTSNWIHLMTSTVGARVGLEPLLE